MIKTLLFIKKVLSILASELAKHGLGWGIGLFSAKMVSEFLVVRGWRNGWGLFTRRTVVSSDDMILIVFFTEGIVGFVVFVLVNQLVKLYQESKAKRKH